MTITALIVFVNLSCENSEQYNTLTTIRNCYLSYFSGSHFNGKSLRTHINHHGSLTSLTYDLKDFKRVTNNIAHDHHKEYILLVEGQEGSDLVKHYQAPENLYIVWTGTGLPAQPARNIQRWYVPNHVLSNQNARPNYWSHCIGLPIDSIENKHVANEGLKIENTISKELKANGFKQRPSLLTELSLYAKQACQQSVEPSTTHRIESLAISSTYRP